MTALESGTQALNHLIFPTLVWGQKHCYLSLGSTEIRELSSAFNQSWANLSQSSQGYQSPGAPMTHIGSSASSRLFQVLGKAGINISGTTVAISPLCFQVHLPQKVQAGKLLPEILLQPGKHGLLRNTAHREGRMITEGWTQLVTGFSQPHLQTKDESFHWLGIAYPKLKQHPPSQHRELQLLGNTSGDTQCPMHSPSVDPRVIPG